MRVEETTSRTHILAQYLAVELESVNVDQLEFEDLVIVHELLYEFIQGPQFTLLAYYFN